MRIGKAVVEVDGDHVRSRHGKDKLHVEVIAGKLIDIRGSQSRFAPPAHTRCCNRV
jgi:hypothetical protein